MPAWFATGNRRLGVFSNLTFFGLPLSYFEGYQDKVMAVDTATIHKAAKTHLRASNYTVLVVGDASTVLGDLDTIAGEGLFGPGSVIHLDTDGNVIKR